MSTSASPATFDSTPLARAAAADKALSAVSGPSTMAPVIMPWAAILESAAASAVAGNAGVTPSTALRIATCGVAMPSACAKSIAFCTMSRLAASVGTIFSTASESTNARGKSGTSTKKACVSLRSLRNPASGVATARIRSSG